MTSPDLTQANIERLAELFPSVVTELRAMPRTSAAAIAMPVAAETKL